jgi:hypothetical protein
VLPESLAFPAYLAKVPDEVLLPLPSKNLEEKLAVDPLKLMYMPVPPLFVVLVEQTRTRSVPSCGIEVNSIAF